LYSGRPAIFARNAQGRAIPQGHQTQPLVLFGKDERLPTPLYSGTVARLYSLGSVAAAQAQVLLLDGQIGAGGEAGEVNRVSGGPGLVQVIDAPDEAAFEVAPGAKFSMWRSPTASTEGAAARSWQRCGQSCSQR